MYTNGLKDRFGSPLISIDYADDRYVRQEEIDFQHKSIEQKIDEVEKNLQFLNDNFYKLKDEVYYDKITSVDDETNDEKIDTLISDLSTYNRYETNYFSTNIENSSATVSSFRFGYKHFPHGFVKRVSLYGRDAITSNIPEAHTTGCYLMANIYKKDGTLVSSTSSTNKLVAQFRPNNSTVVLNTWEFDNLVSPKEDEVIKFIPSPDGVTQVANYNLGILVDNYHTHEDCMCGGDDDFANNPLASGSKWLAIAIIEGDFIYDNENQNHFTDSTKHLNSVERGVIESLYTPTNVLAWDNNFNNETLGATSLKGFIISRPYITNGKFKEVRWTSQGTANGTNLYIKITLRDTNGYPVKSYVSNNTESFNVAGLKSYRFNEEWEVDDSISSISFEPCNADGTIRTDAQMSIRIIGNAVDNDSDGSESTNSNYRINVQFYKIGSVTNKFTSHVGDDTHLTTAQKDTISDCTNLNHTTILESEATESGEFDAVHFNYQDVPHDFHIKKFILKPLESSNTPLYMAVWTLTQSGQKTFVGLSDEAITWEAGKDAVWTFNNVELIVPTNHNVEFFLCTGADAVGETEADAPGVYIKTKYNPSGRGTIRHSNNWHSRCIQATFSNNGYLSHVGDDTHLTTEEKAALQQLVQNGGVTTDSYDWTPDYSAGVEFVCSPNTTYTVPCNGWIIVYQKITTADGVPVISVNGVQILSLLNRTTSEDGLTITGELSGQFPVGENDVITGGVAGQEGIFYPCKGETAE